MGLLGRHLKAEDRAPAVLRIVGARVARKSESGLSDGIHAVIEGTDRRFALRVAPPGRSPYEVAHHEKATRGSGGHHAFPGTTRASRACRSRARARVCGRGGVVRLSAEA